MADTPPNNGRLLARIDERLNQVIKNQNRDQAFNAQKFDVLEQKTDDLARQMAQVNMSHGECRAIQETRWEHHGDDHDQLNTRKNIGDVVAGAVGAIAIVLNALGIGQP